MKKSRPIKQKADSDQKQTSTAGNQQRLLVMGAFPGGSLIPMVHVVEDLTSDEGKTVMEYIEAHSLLPPRPHLLPLSFIQTLGRRLYEAPTIEEKKGILIILAHHGSLAALDILSGFRDSAEASLKHWTQLALDECRTFLAYGSDESDQWESDPNFGGESEGQHMV